MSSELTQIAGWNDARRSINNLEDVYFSIFKTLNFTVSVSGCVTVMLLHIWVEIIQNDTIMAAFCSDSDTKPTVPHFNTFSMRNIYMLRVSQTIQHTKQDNKHYWVHEKKTRFEQNIVKRKPFSFLVFADYNLC